MSSSTATAMSTFSTLRSILSSNSPQTINDEMEIDKSITDQSIIDQPKIDRLIVDQPKISQLGLDHLKINGSHSNQSIIDCLQIDQSILNQTLIVDKPKNGNKRKLAFEAWHRKKMAQMSTTDSKFDDEEIETEVDVEETTSAISPMSQLKRFLSTTPTLLRQNSPNSIDRKNRSIDQSISGDRSSDQETKESPSIKLTKSARSLTTPKLSRHNDAAFYPNIQCILCHEWVCSRNRYMHIESHFQYRPYKCSVCGYDNRKQIFIELHINRVHKGAAQILYHPDSELEKRAWMMAERCLQHTRQVLLRRQLDNKTDDSSTIAEKAVQKDQSPVGATPTTSVATPKSTDLLSYKGVYRPKIYNNQRSEKSNLIEESRMLGLIPDFSEVTAREERCLLCDSHVLKTPSLLEEHARAHLTRPSYGCSVQECTVLHHNRNFVMRHMKEVHRVRRGVFDLLEHDRSLLDEYLKICSICFPDFFSRHDQGTAAAERLKSKFSTNDISAGDKSIGSSGIDHPKIDSPILINSLRSIDNSKSIDNPVTINIPKSVNKFKAIDTPKSKDFPDVNPSIDNNQEKPKSIAHSLLAASNFCSNSESDSNSRSNLNLHIDAQACSNLHNCGANSNATAEIEKDKEKLSIKSVFCRLCHSEINDDPRSHIVHLQYHLSNPIYKCRACPYMDVDVDRTKEHVDDQHQGKVAYYAETLPQDQEQKALRLMEWCFRLSF